jgi:hypothetical protein
VDAAQPMSTNGLQHDRAPAALPAGAQITLFCIDAADVIEAL